MEMAKPNTGPDAYAADCTNPNLDTLKAFVAHQGRQSERNAYVRDVDLTTITAEEVQKPATWWRRQGDKYPSHGVY